MEKFQEVGSSPLPIGFETLYAVGGVHATRKEFSGDPFSLGAGLCSLCWVGPLPGSRPSWR
eukprot:1313123-Pyramimonas_sp.AAC.2